eukprot:350273-Chlamydomonas_euryale.AAC.1
MQAAREHESAAAAVCQCLGGLDVAGAVVAGSGRVKLASGGVAVGGSLDVAGVGGLQVWDEWMLRVGCCGWWEPGCCRSGG